ncbi:MAG: hypothetical protein KFF73_08250 [Cyclobacteriaceae bacterium]|nr:hypothetical protein [Cyclobacteriaceae bacterium]
MKISIFKKSGENAPEFLSRFDSATDLAGALSSFLRDEEYSKMGTLPMGRILSPLVNNFPDKWKKNLYFYGGVYDSASKNQIDEIDAEKITRWIYHIYPARKYPAIAIGSSNGALNHLFAALKIPWLPNTFLVPIYKGRKFSVDRPKLAIDWSLYQMMDPVYDRIRAGSIAYFRIKKQVLGSWYKKFIKDYLEPEGTLFIIDCKLSWPAIRISDRHTFQFGGLGDIKPEEFYYGSERIREFLLKEKAPVEAWDVPEPDTVSPEAKWGFNRDLMKDIDRMCQSEGYRLAKISFNHPQDPGPNVADIFREWNRCKKQPYQRLLVESFNIHSPSLVMKTSSIPFWLFFNTNPAAQSIENYLNETDPYDEILMMILSHGHESVGGVGIERWRSILSAARKKGLFVGVDSKSYPLDLGIYAHFKTDLKKLIPDRYPAHQMKMNEFQDKYSNYLNDRKISLKYKVL